MLKRLSRSASSRAPVQASPVRDAPGLFDLIFEAAGVLGLIASLLLCMLAFAAVVGPVFWMTGIIAVAGTLAYLVYQFTRRATGASGLGWRQMVIATMVPVLALLVAVLIGGQHLGLVSLPFGHRAVKVQRHVITVEKKANGQVVTHTTEAPADSDSQ